MGQIKNIKLHIVTDIKICIHLSQAIQVSNYFDNKDQGGFNKRSWMQFQARIMSVAVLLCLILLFVNQAVDAIRASASAAAAVEVGDEESLSDALQRTAEELGKW